MISKRMLASILGLAVVLSVPLATRAGEPGPSADKPGAQVTDQALVQMAEKAGISKPVAEDMGPELLYDLARFKIQQESRPNGGYVAAWAVPIATFTATFLIIAIILLYRYRRDRNKHETIRLMLEKGAEIPKELLDPPVRARSDLRRGILVLSTGVGYCIFMLLLALKEPNAIAGAPVGVVPILIGIGYLVVSRLNKKTQA